MTAVSPGVVLMDDEYSSTSARILELISKTKWAVQDTLRRLAYQKQMDVDADERREGW